MRRYAVAARSAGGASVPVTSTRVAFDDLERYLVVLDLPEEVAGSVKAPHEVRGAVREALDGLEPSARDVDADDAAARRARVVRDAHIRIARKQRVLEHEPPPRRVGERELGRAHACPA